VARQTKKATGRRAAAQAANSRRRRRKRRGRKTIHYALLVIFVLAAGAILSFTAFFKVEEVRVVGCDRYSDTELIRDSGIRLEDNLLRVSTDQVEQLLLEKYPYIESVRVRRKLPPAIELQITQSVPSVAIMDGDEIVMITKQGKVLERGKLFIPPEIPVVKGISTVMQDPEWKPDPDKPDEEPRLIKVQPGQVLGVLSREGLVMLDYLFEAAEKTGFEHITNVDITNPLNMLIVFENRLLLKMGTEADLDHKLVFIQAVLEELEPSAQARIDASNAKSKKELVIKNITLEQALALEEGKRAGDSSGEAPGRESGFETPAEEQGDGQSGGEELSAEE